MLMPASAAETFAAVLPAAVLTAAVASSKKPAPGKSTLPATRCSQKDARRGVALRWHSICTAAFLALPAPVLRALCSMMCTGGATQQVSRCQPTAASREVLGRLPASGCASRACAFVP